MVEDGYEFFAKRQLVTLFSAPNYCGEFDNAGAMMSVDDTLLCSFQVSGLASLLAGFDPANLCRSSNPQRRRRRNMVVRTQQGGVSPAALHRSEVADA